MKQLAAKFLNKSGYFPEVKIKAEAFDNHQSVEFKNQYSCSCYANDNTLDIILAYDDNIQGVDPHTRRCSWGAWSLSSGWR